MAGEFRVVIAGAGFGGLGAAVNLKRAGIDDFVLLEASSGVGGTWEANTYPGCQCDVPSHLYSFSFAPNPGWTRTYSLQPEIRAYLDGCARRFSVLPHIRFRTPLTAATWDEDAQRWRVETPDGIITAEVLVAAMGFLNTPAMPDIPGLESFEGAVFHSARWDHSHDLRGERVAVIGTGASAVQLIPRIQPQVGALHVYQRTPPWVLPHRDRPISTLERVVYRRVPGAQRLVRWSTYWAHEAYVPLYSTHHRRGGPPERLARAHLGRQVPDPALRARLTPDYEVFCKRILLSNTYYPALQQPNVEVVTEPIREVRGRGIVTADGCERPVETIICATGFRVTDAPWPGLVQGRRATLAEAWAGSPEAYRGTTVAGFPNLFVLLGPNTGLGHTSVVFMIEAQIAYLMDCLRRMEERGWAAVEVRRDAQESFNRRIQRRLARSVWNTGGCRSWYLDRNGNNSTLWPGTTARFWRQTRRFDAESYVLTRPPARG